MGKQTKQRGSHFGGQWTKEKLAIINDYLSFYTTALSKQQVKLVYIDAFAGSGKTVLSDGGEVDGSAVLSLNYDFDEYYFLEIDQKRKEELEQIVNTRFLQKMHNVHIINDNCNNRLGEILDGLTVYQRGVMFLDPYALELDWSVLVKANKTKILDIWYLFPVNALTRNLPNNKQYSETTSQKIDSILGTHDWEGALYKKDPQISMFDSTSYCRVNFEGLVNYITNRLSSTFAYVSPKSRILKNSKNSPLFVLYFMMTNDSPRAIGLGSKVVTQIFDKVDKMTKGVSHEENYTTNTAI